MRRTSISKSLSKKSLKRNRPLVDKDAGFNRIREVFFALCKSVDTPVSLGAWLRYKHGEFLQLVSMSVDPRDYTSSHDFKLDYLVTEYLSKYKGFDTGVDKKAVAIQKFIASEDKCRMVNSTFRMQQLRGFSPRVEAVMFTAQRKIAAVLGDIPMSIFDTCRWGPGVTTSIRGSGVSMGDKIREFPIRVSMDALPYMKHVFGQDIHWAQACGIPAEGPFSPLGSCFTIEPCARVTTVPKSAKTDRTIGIEPTGNIFLQLGIGGYIRERLRKRGVDLNDQLINRDLAKLGSKFGHLATVDLSSASDTISFHLVLALLPPSWFNLLDNVRSKSYTFNGEATKTYEKFSAMGNGFTFELESLIFWAIAQSISELEGVGERVSVYGDDIILPVECLPYLQEVFDAVGFTVNTEKTHFASAFRESCGGHYYLGRDVTPIYQK
nr:MAG: RNA-dependent RNA polymerase [Riboviria sp.]